MLKHIELLKEFEEKGTNITDIFILGYASIEGLNYSDLKKAWDNTNNVLEMTEEQWDNTNNVLEMNKLTKLDSLKGKMSIRSINTLKRLGYEYLEEVNLIDVERRVAGKKTKKEILDFIGGYLKMRIKEIFKEIKKDYKQYGEVFQMGYFDDWINDTRYIFKVEGDKLLIYIRDDIEELEISFIMDIDFIIDSSINECIRAYNEYYFYAPDVFEPDLN